MKLHMFLGHDNLSYSAYAASKLEALKLVEATGVSMKCYLGAQ
jgi:hypothetical protein